MKQVICFAVVALVAAMSISVDGFYSDRGYYAELAKHEEACQASEGATTDDVEAFRRHRTPTTQTAKCLFGCVFEKMGLMSNGAFSRALADQTGRSRMGDNPEKLQQFLDRNIACEKEVGTSTDKCITGPLVMLCLEKNMGM